MSKILLDYVFPISVITPTPAASTAFLKQVAVVCRPKSGQEANVGQVYECTSMSAVAVRTDNTNAQQLFNAGMTKVFIILANELDLSAIVAAHENEWYTILISSDFVDADVTPTQSSLTKGDLTFTAVDAGQLGDEISLEFLDTGVAGSEVVTVVGKKISVSMDSTTSTATQLKTAIDNSAAAMLLIQPVAIASGQGAVAQTAFVEDFLENGDGLFVGDFEGVVGYSTHVQEFAAAFAVGSNRCAFFDKETNASKNMFYAFGKLLSNQVNWRNQQYIEMPFNDEVDELGDANSLFEDKVSFVINDDEFSNRLALFVAGGKAIAAPYILKNLRINLQSRSTQWISQNQPQYTKKEAALLETRLQEDVINSFISLNWIESGSISITLVQANFVASGEIEVPTPKALWRVFNEMTETA